jgi:methionine-rich copper-binding protein CopC
MKTRKLAATAALLASLAVGGVYLWPGEMRLVETWPTYETADVLYDGEIELLFNKPVNVAETKVTVTDPEANVVSNGGKLYMDKGVLVVKLKAPIKSGLLPGEYRVEWRATATDGSKGAGNYRFIAKDAHAGHGEHKHN